MKKLLFIATIAFSLLLSSCVSFPKKSVAYSGCYKEKPISVLIMPPINRTMKVEAKDYFQTTLLQPLAEAGYYVIPPFLSMEILKKESAYDSELFIEKPLKLFGDVFGADVALFTIINSWEKSKIGGTVTVGVEYIVKSTTTNNILYSRKGTIIYDTSVDNNAGGLGGLAASVAMTAIKTATTDYLPVASTCNRVTLQDMPKGKYSPKFDKDGEESSGPKNFEAVVQNGSVKSVRVVYEKKKKK